MTPRVSVVLPTHDRMPALQRALASVHGQSFREFEVIVVDDASADGTREWLAAATGGTRVTRLASPVGAAGARNQGLRLARGELIAFLDDDDVWHPTYLENQVRHLDADAGAALSYADHIEVSGDGRSSHPDTEALFDYTTPLVRMLAEGFIHTMSVVVCRRTLFEKWGPFKEELSIVHDLEWYARLLAARQRVIRLPLVLVERAVPGGLVTRHRQWFSEEDGVIADLCRGGQLEPDGQRLVRAYRSVFHAKLAVARGDLPFGLARAADALRASPWWALRVAARRVLRRMKPSRRLGPPRGIAEASP